MPPYPPQQLQLPRSPFGHALLYQIVSGKFLRCELFLQHRRLPVHTRKPLAFRRGALYGLAVVAVGLETPEVFLFPLLLQQYHLLGIREAAGIEAVEVHTTCQIISMPFEDYMSGLLST